MGVDRLRDGDAMSYIADYYDYFAMLALGAIAGAMLVLLTVPRCG